MFMTIVNAIAAIPKLIDRIEQVLAWMQKVEQEKWFERNNEAFDALKKAQTSEEMMDAAKKIQDQIRGL